MTKEKPHQLLYILIAMAVVSVIAGVILLVTLDRQPETRGNTIGNNGSYGMAVATPEGVFYANSGILQYTGTDQMPRLVSSDEAMFLSYHKGYLYYSNIGEHGALYRIRTDGTRREKLSELRTESIEIHNGVVYFATTLLGGQTDTSGIGIYRYTPQDGHIILLSNHHADHLTYRNNHLLFTDRNNGYRFSSIAVDGTNFRAIGEDFVHAYDISGQYIYFSTSEAIYRMRFDGSQKIKLADTGATSLIAADGSIFYVCFDALSSGTSSGLMQLTSDGKVKTISNTAFMSINTMEEGHFLGAAYTAAGMNMVRFKPASGTAEVLPSGSGLNAE